MNKIPLKEAIEAGAWFECWLKWYAEGHNIVRLRVVAFAPFHQLGLDTSAVTELGDDGVLWAMTIEAEPASYSRAFHQVAVVDDDGFVFTTFLWKYEYHELKAGLRRFQDWSQKPTPGRKIMGVGGIPFLLPQQESNYYLTILDGTIREA